MSLLKNISPEKSTAAERGAPYGERQLCPLGISASKHGIKLKLAL